MLVACVSNSADLSLSLCIPTLGTQYSMPILAIPLWRSFQLTHLKRIKCSTQSGGGRVLEVLLSLPDIYKGLTDIERRELEGNYNLKPTLRPVPELEPRTRRQFERGQSAWPMIFHHRCSLRQGSRAVRTVLYYNMMALAFDPFTRFLMRQKSICRVMGRY